MAMATDALTNPTVKAAIEALRRASGSVREEMPIFLLVFAIPAVVALLAWWRLR
jgi:hypothetical protein